MLLYHLFYKFKMLTSEYFYHGQVSFYTKNLNNKSQIANHKQIPMTKIQNLKRFGHWILEFDIYL